MMDSGMLRRAAVFHAVGSAGGITAAGERLGKSPPAVHADLRRFEREIGAALTERVGRALRLTPQGKTLFVAVGRALSDLDRACISIDDEEDDRPALRLGAVTGFGRYRFIPALLPLLPATQPLLLRTASHDALLNALGRGEIDLMVTYRPVIAAPFESVKIADEELILCGAAGEDRLAQARAGRLPFVTYDEYEYVFGRWFSEIFEGQPAMLRRHDHCDELEEALASVSAGRGYTIAPADACRHFGLTQIGPSCRNSLFLSGTRSALLSPEAVLIRACLEAERT